MIDDDRNDAPDGCGGALSAIAVRAMRPADSAFVAQQMALAGDLSPHRTGWAADRLAMLTAAGQLRGMVLETLTPVGRRMVGCGLSGFLAAPALRGFLDDPWPDLTETLLEPRSSDASLLDEPAIAAGNSGSGLDLAVLHFSTVADLGEATCGRLLVASISDFVAVHRGYRLNHFLRIDPPPMNEMSLQTGMKQVHAFPIGATRRSGGQLEAPRAVMLYRAGSEAGYGSVSSVLFSYSPPIIGFSLAEARLLSLADLGLSDDEIALALEVSPHTVRQAWRSIFARAQRRLPAALGLADTDVLTPTGRRGAEKRRHLLAYLKLHPSELRPHLSRQKRSGR